MKLLLTTLFLLMSSMQAQWQKIPVSTTASLRGLSVVNANIVWASGTEGTVIRTGDSGKTWSAMTVPGAEKLDFRGIKAFDANTAVIISSGPAEKEQAKIFRTTDGGRNWKQVFEEKRTGIFFDAIAFWDQQHGIVLSDPVEGKFALFTTDDGGATWKQLSPANLPAASPKEGAFAASNSCLVVQGTSNVWFATGGASVARVFRSSDRGKTWAVADTPMHPANASSGIFSLAFKDEKNGIAVGGDYQKPEGSDLPNVMQTKDGGKTWQAGVATEPAGVYLSGVATLPISAAAKSVSVGIKGMYLPTIISNGGWTHVEEENLNSVATFKNADLIHIWAVGPKGTVMHSTMQLGMHL
jgi:photosystem II stability/assembly factor-like uncharacterized protein